MTKKLDPDELVAEIYLKKKERNKMIRRGSSREKIEEIDDNIQNLREKLIRDTGKPLDEFKKLGEPDDFLELTRKHPAWSSD